MFGGEKVVVLVGVVDVYPGSLYAFVSRDGGRSFGRARRVGSLRPGAASARGPDGRISILTSSDTVVYQAVSLTHATEKSAILTTEPAAQHPSLALDETGVPIVTFDDLHRIFFRRWSRRGDVNDEGDWTSPAVVSRGSDGRLAAGPGGVYLLHTRAAGAGRTVLVVRRFDGSGFGPAVEVSERGDPISGDIAEGRQGRLYAAWVAGDRSLRLRAAGNGSWGPTHVVAPARAGPFYEVHVRTGNGGHGIVTWIASPGPGELHAAPFDRG
jgi:hypothetical protein